MSENKKKYLEYHKECCEKMLKIVEAKNHDYAGFSEDPFGNFKMVEKCGINTAEKGFLTRMLDKITRINSFLEQNVLNVKDEKIEDTCIDLANYSLLLANYIKTKKEESMFTGNINNPLVLQKDIGFYSAIIWDNLKDAIKLNYPNEGGIFHLEKASEFAISFANQTQNIQDWESIYHQGFLLLKVDEEKIIKVPCEDIETLIVNFVKLKLLYR